MPVSEHSEFLKLREYLNQQVIGQEGLTLRLLIALLADGHLLVEGAPGLAKTATDCDRIINPHVLGRP